jgi:futalosine hydrolase
MNILIVAATIHEIGPFIEHYEMRQLQQHLWIGKINQHQVYCLISGIGMVATAYHLTKAISKENFHLIINAGIAGSFSKNMPLGCVVDITSEQFADFGIDDKGIYRSVFEANFMDGNAAPYSNGVLVNPVKHPFTNHLPKVSGITVNTATGSKERIKMIEEKFNPDIENMEGAAVFYIALQQSIPFAEIRSVSNIVEPRNRNNWNISLAIENLNSTLIGIFAEI